MPDRSDYLIRVYHHVPILTKNRVRTERENCAHYHDESQRDVARYRSARESIFFRLANCY
jgi:hypothetical protein